MAQLDTMHVLAQPWDQAWVSLNLRVKSQSEKKKKLLFPSLATFPTPFKAALLQSWCTLHVSNIFMQTDLLSLSAKVSVSC